MSAEVETRDIAIASWWMMRGLSLVRTSGPEGNIVFVFADPDGRAQQLKIEFANSDCFRFDAALRTLKKFRYERRRTKPKTREA